MSLKYEEVDHVDLLERLNNLMSDEELESETDNIGENFQLHHQAKESLIVVDLDETQTGLKVQTEFTNEDNINLYERFKTISGRWSPLGANCDESVEQARDILEHEEDKDLSKVQHMYDGLLRADTPKSIDFNKLKSMEEEQEMLTSSLMALTSHFAQVQLRVRQIVEAKPEERDALLKELDEFAFRGIPEPVTSVDSIPPVDKLKEHLRVEDIRQKQCEMIEQLKNQLCELEKYAYESGAPVLPQHILLEKQKIIIDELKHKLNLKVSESELPQLSPEDLKSHVDTAIGEFVGPMKMKEQLVAQLKTQITDLERFISFLQGDTEDRKFDKQVTNEAYNSYAAKKKVSNRQRINSPAQGINVDLPSAGASSSNSPRTESLNSKAHGLMDRASVLMQMFASTHLGLKPDRFQKNILKKTSKGNHWGDLRAQLEIDIQEVAALAATLSFDREKLINMRKTLKKRKLSSSNQPQNGTVSTTDFKVRTKDSGDVDFYSRTSSSDSDENDEFYDWEKYRKRISHCNKNSNDSISLINKELTTAVRKNFAMTLKRLMQHGLRTQNETAISLIVPFLRCLNPSALQDSSPEYRAAKASSFLARNTLFPRAAHFDNDEDEQQGGLLNGSNGRQMHAWELILQYYYLKNGDEYNNTPARKLSQSFNLEIVGSQATSCKQTLLSAIGMIIGLHRPYKRSYNAHFKAFVCAALNSAQLVEWLNLIFGCSELVETYYTSNSYVRRTGFRDSLRSIDVLSKYDFDLPVDLAVRHFRNI